MSDDKPAGQESASLIESLLRLSGQVAGGTLELARSTATLTAMFGESWLRQALNASLEPERLEAMAEAGHFLRDARETAGMTLKDLADSLGVSDKRILEDVESGERIMPLELVLRSASLLARHDPIPFLLKFMRTYNPELEKTLESWGVMALPRQYERERRFINLYRKHDILRSFTDAEFQRYLEYMESSSNLVLELMAREKEANTPRSRKSAGRKATTAKAGGGKTKSAKGSPSGAKSRKSTPREAAPKKAAPRASRSGTGRSEEN
ncbi:helix-turn-helix domain-containing protein [Parahaliea maris]|uniref:Helix-turn-helix domain-containing protein n=1 Tax=Parahaliea maris TaxID=2716870 RepID=A0A5C9A465_9GAMM|nr:helix-turn-helix transcriptional regulator [Parahaliea maris]TXS95675.1 helix-turn-helix domain-containing protein [Parahaliea maris]